MPNYLFLKKNYKKNLWNFLKACIFWGKINKFKKAHYRNAEINSNTQLFPLHNEPSPMPVG